MTFAGRYGPECRRDVADAGSIMDSGNVAAKVLNEVSVASASQWYIQGGIAGKRRCSRSYWWRKADTR